MKLSQNFRRARQNPRNAKKRLSFEQLEARQLLATITFENPLGGMWHMAANWDLNRVPGSGDDVVIPKYDGNPVIRFDVGSTTIRNLSTSENIRMAGGTLKFDRVDQLEGSFVVEAGTLNGGVFTHGPLIVSGSKVTVGSLKVARDATFRLEEYSAISIPAWGAVQIDGTANVSFGSTIIFDAHAFPQQPQVIVGGTLSADGAIFTTKNGNNHQSGAITIESGGRMIAKSSRFSSPIVTFKPGAIIGATDLVNNLFDARLFIPAKSIAMLSSASGGSDNRSFREIYIWNDTLNSGELSLKAIGTESTNNLVYGFFESFTIGRAAKLRVADNVRIYLMQSSQLNISGEVYFEQGSSLAFRPNYSPQHPEIVVKEGGKLIAKSATFTTSTPNNYANGAMTVKSGGQIIATSSVFSGPSVSFELGAIIGPKDLSDNVFDASLFIPATSIAMFSAMAGGSDNRRFREINFWGEKLSNHETLVLSAIGTQSTRALKYVFYESFAIGATARLVVDPDIFVRIYDNSILTVDGTATFFRRTRLDFYAGDAIDKPQLIVNGTLTTDGLSFVSGNYANKGRFVVSSTGIIEAKNSSFPTADPRFGLASTVIFNSDDGSTFQLGFSGLSTELTEIDRFVLTNESNGVLQQSMRIGSSSYFSVSDSSSFTTTGSLKIESQSSTSFLPRGAFRFNGRGTSASPQLLEVLSRDLGDKTSEGFASSNYQFGSIETFGGSYVQLIDQVDNSLGSGSEAIYTNALIVRTGSTLDLKGLHLYTRSILVENGGKIINGTVEPIFPDGGLLTLGQPTPGKIEAQGAVDTWEFFGRAGGWVSVKVNPGATEKPAPVSPILNFARVQLLDRTGRPLLTADSNVAGALAAINNYVLPATDTYLVRVSSAPNNAFPTGNYIITALDTTPNPRGTAIQISSSQAGGSVYGQEVALTVNVSPLVATGEPVSGSVQVRIDGEKFETPVVLANEMAMIGLPRLRAGTRIVTVDFISTSSSYDSSSSKSFAQIVNLAPLKIVVDHKTKVAGAPLPELTASYVEFVSGENTSDLAGNLALAVSQEAINKAGVFAINGSASTLASDNYAIQIVNGTLTVSAAAPSSLTALAGGNQSVKVNRGFPSLLKVRVMDAFGNLVPGASVAFTAPATIPSGTPSGTFADGMPSETRSTNANGEATSSAFMAGNDFGDYSVVATVGALSTSFALTNIEAGRPLEVSLEFSRIAEKDGQSLVTIARNGSNTSGLSVNLVSSDPARLSIPSSILIFANTDKYEFAIRPTNNQVADGDQVLRIEARAVDAALSELVATESLTILDDEVAQLSLVLSTPNVSENSGRVTGTLSRNTPIGTQLAVDLSAGLSGRLRLHSTVSIEPGQSSVSFEIESLNNPVAEGDQTVAIMATATGLAAATQELKILEDDAPKLDLTFSQSDFSEAVGAVTATLARNTPPASDLVVELGATHAQSVSVPTTVTIPKGQTSVSFPVTVINDTVARGDPTVDISATAANHFAALGSLTVRDDELAQLDLVIRLGSISENGGVTTTTATVTRNTPIDKDLVVEILNDKPDQLQMNAQVTIPAGANSATFALVAVDDTLLDRTQTVKVTAKGSGMDDGVGTIDVLDYEELKFDLSTVSISERGGQSTATITRSNTDIELPLTVNLEVDIVSEASVPSSVIIPAGQSAVSFLISAVDDRLLDGLQNVQVFASAQGYNSPFRQLDVTDVEELLLTIDTSVIVAEGTGPVSITLTRLNLDNIEPLTVLLSSNDETEVTIPSSVAIPANESSVTFEIAAIDDLLRDGAQTVVLTAKSVESDQYQYVSGTLTIDIQDKRLPEWQNPQKVEDVNDDSFVSAIDALLIINELNRGGGRRLDPVRDGAFFDVNGDDFLSPIDALFIINYLNRSVISGGEGETDRRVPELGLAAQSSVDAHVYRSRKLEYADNRNPSDADRWIGDSSDALERLRRKLIDDWYGSFGLEEDIKHSVSYM